MEHPDQLLGKSFSVSDLKPLEKTLAATYDPIFFCNEKIPILIQNSSIYKLWVVDGGQDYLWQKQLKLCEIDLNYK